MLNRIRSLFRVLVSQRDFEDGMSEELRFHMDQYTSDLVRSGVSPEEAARRARLEFGNVTNVKVDCRESRGLHPFDELTRQLRYAARMLRKNPGFAITALLTFAICLGANLMIFAVVDAVLLRPLPFPDAGRLVTLFNTYPKAGVERDGSSITNYYERRGQIPAFTSLAIYRYGTAIVGEAGSTEREPITQVSPDFFGTLGVGLEMGRTFTEDETSFKADNVAILTNPYWRQHLNGDPQVIGKQIRVDGVPRTVIGVLPVDFRFLSSESRLYFPFSSDASNRTPRQRHSGGNVTQMIARLKPGATVAQAQSQIDAQNATLEMDDPQAKMMAEAGFRTMVVPLHADHVASIRPTLLLLQAGVLALLLIGAVNLINLLLIRASGRAKEIAVRQSLGAGRRHLISEVMVETVLLAFLGGLLGLAFGALGIRLLDALGADQLPLGAFITFDMRVAFVGLAAAIGMGIVLAAPIAWFNLRGHQANALNSEARGGTASRAAQGLRHSFIVAQVAIAFILLTGAGLLGLSLKQAMAVSPGFRASHILTGRVALPSKNYPDDATRLAFTERLMKEIGRQPGLLAVGIVTNVPLSGKNGKSAATVKGFVRKPGESARGHYSYGVGGDYFTALGFTLREGRFLTEDDSHRGERVCVVDEDFARYYWPHTSALGQRLFEGSEEGKDAEAFTIVGVVGSVKQAGLTDVIAQGAVYYPYIFRADDFFVTARTALPPESLGLTLQKVVRQIDPDLPITDVRSMETRIADSLITRRSPALLAGLFSLIAVLLTAIGTYGVLSFAVAQRRREIGVRMALGARPDQIRSQFLSLATRLLVSGMALGLGGAWLAGQAMQAVLFEVQAVNVLILAATAFIMALVSLAACLAPSHRAARISPMEALADQ
jgi:predicted permease